MARKPDKQKVIEYDQTRLFGRVMFFLLNKVAEQTGEQAFFPDDIPDSWRSGDQTISAALSGMKMACRDILEMTQDYDAAMIEVWDQALSSQGAPTLSEMRIEHWKLIPKILKRGQIKDDEEYYLIKSSLDRIDISDNDRAKLFSLVDCYELSIGTGS